MSKPFPGKDVPVVDGSPATMFQTWYDYFQSLKVKFASKADQQAGTSNSVIVTPAHQQDHVSAAKVVLSFSSAGTVLTNYNVASVVHTGTGVYTVTFTVPFSSANYAAIVTCNTGFEWYFSSKLAGSIVINTFNSSFVAADVAADLICFGSQ
jgi:hypothetical protein